MSPDLNIIHPISTPPSPGEAVTVAPGIAWARLPLPFRLDHVNIYLIEDGRGVAVVDTGIDTPAGRAGWARLLAGPLAGRPITRLIATHYHPDHLGLANWLATEHDVPLEMSETEYLTALVPHLDPRALEADLYRDFYLRQGLDAEATDAVVTRGHDYLRMVSGVPKTFRRLIAGERLRIGGRDFTVLTGGGHAPEQVMLYCAGDRVFLSADQVLPRITPNIGVSARDPDGDPLGIFLRSIREIRDRVDADALTLPGHDLPFIGLHGRIDALLQHHEDRCAEIVAACRAAPRSVAELVPVIFHRPLDAHQTGFAVGEVLAHVNYLRRRGRLHPADGLDPISRMVA